MNEETKAPQSLSELTAKMAAPAAAGQTMVKPAGPDKQGWYRGTGRRKTAVARVRLKPGKAARAGRGRQPDRGGKVGYRLATVTLEGGKQSCVDVIHGGISRVSVRYWRYTPI